MNDYEDSYAKAMQAAGATIHVYETFGSYQGDWWARVTLADGRSGWIKGSYGSCSGCDAFEAEFGWGDRGRCGEHEWDEPSEVCAACAAAQVEYRKRLADFGAHYLDDLMTQDAAEAEAVRNIEWDSEAETMLAFLKSNAGSPQEQRG